MQQLFTTPKWPEEPLFYASFPSMTDENVAPKGKEGLFFNTTCS